MSDDLAAQLTALTARVAELEDRAAITALIAAYGPAVDRADGAAVADLWTEDGTYRVAGFAPWQGRDALTSVVTQPEHAAYLAAGCAHVSGLPDITVQGDAATAVNYTRVYLHQAGTWRADRVSVNRWEFERTSAGWRVADRSGHLVDGSPAARDILG